MKYTKQDWLDKKVAIKWHNFYSDELNSFMQKCNSTNGTISGSFSYYVGSPTGSYTATNSIETPAVFIYELFKFTRQDWIDGECMIQWDDTFAIELTNFFQSINSGNPIPNGKGKYYYSINSLGYYNSCNKTTLPIVSVQGFLPKIIGYKLIKPEYEIASDALLVNGHGLTPYRVAKIGHDYYKIDRHSDTIATLEKAGVLDLWYKAIRVKLKTETVYLGERQIVIDSNGTIKGPHNEYNINSFKKILEQKINGFPYDVTPTTFRFGCVDNITIEQIKILVDVYDKLNSK